MKGTTRIFNKYSELENKIEKRTKNRNEYSIQLSIDDENDIYNKYSLNGNTQIKNEIIDYLEEQVKYVSIAHSITIQVEYKSKNQSTISILQMLIKDKLEDRLSILYQEIHSKLRETILFVILGLISFFLLSIVGRITSSRTIKEILLIICWVFIWKAVEIYFMERRKLVSERLKLMKLYFAKYSIK